MLTLAASHARAAVAERDVPGGAWHTLAGKGSALGLATAWTLRWRAEDMIAAPSEQQRGPEPYNVSGLELRNDASLGSAIRLLPFLQVLAFQERVTLMSSDGLRVEATLSSGFGSQKEAAAGGQGKNNRETTTDPQRPSDGFLWQSDLSGLTHVVSPEDDTYHSALLTTWVRLDSTDFRTLRLICRHTTFCCLPGF